MGRLHVRIQPGARTSKVAGWYGELPKIAVAAPPVDGAANAEAIRLLASVLERRERQIRLVGGARSRTKRFEIDGLDAEEIIARFEAIHPRPGHTRPNRPGTR